MPSLTEYGDVFLEKMMKMGKVYTDGRTDRQTDSVRSETSVELTAVFCSQPFAWAGDRLPMIC